MSPPGATDQGGFCERCQKEVHDVSRMRESELRRFLAARVGTRVCLAYQADARGNLRLQAEPPRLGAHPIALGALALLLAACAGYANELEAPGEVCHDEDGYAVSCPTWSDRGMHSVPEGLAAPRDGDEGCPVRPTAEAEAPEPPIGGDAIAELAPPAGPNARPVPDAADTSADTSAEASGTSAKMRVNFSIDPEQSPIRGLVYVSDGGWIDRDFVPTAQLWKQWKQRRAEQRAARARWRASRD